MREGDNAREGEREEEREEGAGVGWGGVGARECAAMQQSDVPVHIGKGRYGYDLFSPANALTVAVSATKSEEELDSEHITSPLQTPVNLKPRKTMSHVPAEHSSVAVHQKTTTTPAAQKGSTGNVFARRDGGGAGGGVAEAGFGNLAATQTNGGRQAPALGDHASLCSSASSSSLPPSFARSLAPFLRVHASVNRNIGRDYT